MVRGPRRLHVIVICVLFSGVIVGVGTAGLGALAPSFSRWASSVPTIALMTTAGWSLMTVGAARLWREGPRSTNLALLAAGFAWFAGEWANPATAPAAIFTAGLLLGNSWPALLAHGVLDGGGPIGSRWSRLVVSLAYITNVGILGILPTVFFDPIASRCSLCPVNVLAIGSDPALVLGSIRLGLALEAAWVLAAVVLIAVELVRASATDRRRTGAVHAAAAVALGGAGLHAAYSFPRGLLSNDPVDITLGSVAAVALIALASAEAAGWVRRRQTRQRVARLALELANAPATGELARALGRELGDSTLEILYPLDDGRLVDAAGVSSVAAADSSRSTTDVRRGGAVVAVLAHRADLGNDSERLADAVGAARLALENERLHAQSQARLLELRTSRRQIVSAAEGERRRLERDLHDGSQQRMLAFAIDIAIARERTSGSPSAEDDELAALESEVRGSLEDLRELAHGIIPRSLADDGLGAALEELAERSVIPIDLVALTWGRLDRAVEAAAFIVAARSIREPVVRRASIGAAVDDGRLIVDVRLEVTGEIAASTVLDLEDRCGAVDGTMELRLLPGKHTVHLRAEIPCGS